MGVNGSFDTSMGASVGSGLLFTLKMAMVAVSIAIGVFISLIPRVTWIISDRIDPDIREGDIEQHSIKSRDRRSYSALT